ncbi:hypothetical protein E4U60_004705 [Claviceps pazoutovae]|uniref:Uncharacterized protein n=1 Tax=Claviceps pazoutovae TaxID=1649127 RepID=A0A9P7M8D9_9HYPO|nr:hypothetical protein E4U60_004705 [Claviceps pazoutovae]
MQQACRAKVAISRAHRAQARHDLQPSPSQTPPLPDIVRRRQELEALHRRHGEELEVLHRRHEEELMAGASPSPTPAIREHMGQRRGRAVLPSPSSPFSRQNKLNGFPDNLNGFPDNLNGGESWIGIPAIITWLSSGAFLPKSSHPSTLPPLPTPDADVPYIEGTTTLDDLAITNTDIDCIKRWRENLDKNKQQRGDRCNCFWFDLNVVSGICKGCREADTIRRNPGRGQRGPGMPELWSAENKLDLGVVPADLPQ